MRFFSNSFLWCPCHVHTVLTDDQSRCINMCISCMYFCQLQCLAIFFLSFHGCQMKFSYNALIVLKEQQELSKWLRSPSLITDEVWVHKMLWAKPLDQADSITFLTQSAWRGLRHLTLQLWNNLFFDSQLQLDLKILYMWFCTPSPWNDVQRHGLATSLAWANGVM